jgi:hypothetical protein
VRHDARGKPEVEPGSPGAPCAAARFADNAQVGLLVWLGTGAVLAAVTIWLAGVLAWEASPARMSDDGRFARSGLAPEPSERAIFAALLALVGPLLLAFARFATRLPAGGIVGRALWALAGASVGLGAALTIESDSWQSIVGNGLSAPAHIACVAGAALATTFALRARQVGFGRARWAFVAVLIVATAAAALRTLTRPAAWLGPWYPDVAHIESVLYSVAQARGGAACLVDFVPHYGCYADLLRPVFAVTGLSVASLTATMAVLQVVAVALVLVVLAREVRAPVVLAACSLGIALWLGWLGAPSSNAALYMQYAPLRVLGPSAILALAAAWLHRPTTRGAGTIGVLATALTYWNFDSGLAALGAWLVLVCARGLAVGASAERRARAVHAIAAFAGVLFAACILGACLVVRGGRAGDIAQLWSAPREYFLAGFNMLPMPRHPALWCVAAAIHLGALALGAAHLFARPIDRRCDLLLFTGVLGTGLFAYYQGRSVETNLFACSWITVVDIALVTDLVVSSPARSHARLASAAAAVFVVAYGGLVSATLIAPRSRSVVATWRERLGPPPYRSEVPPKAAFVREELGGAIEALVVSQHQAAIQIEAGIRAPLGLPGIAEIVLNAEARRVRDAIANASVRDVFVDAVVSPDLPRDQLIGPTTALEARYDLVRWDPSHTLAHWRRR